jgi:hypothetical protein
MAFAVMPAGARFNRHIAGQTLECALRGGVTRRERVVGPFWITEIGGHELTGKIRWRVSGDTDDLPAGRGQRFDRGIPFDAPVMTNRFGS